MRRIVVQQRELAMNLRYPQLSAGYIGQNAEQATLNSQYYNLFLNEINQNPQLLTTILLFPQRIPRSGFFDELSSLEVTEFKSEFKKTVNIMAGQFALALTHLTANKSPENARKVINSINLLLRYGRFDIIKKNFKFDYSGPYELEIKTLLVTADIETQLSNGKPITVNKLILLANTYIKNNTTTIREKILLLNRIIVYFYRYQKIVTDHLDVIRYGNLLIELLDKFEDGTLLNKLYCSIAFRGLAMIHELEFESKSNFLQRSVNLARSIKGSTEIDRIVATENLYTCLQSLAKWHQNNKDYVAAEYVIQEMITLDQHDSTGYSEMGFLYFKRDKFEKAKFYFKKAMELGPPGAGMNAYYYAECLKMTGHTYEAIEYLYKSAELDKQAISPWLDLLEHFRDREPVKAVEIANHIYITPILMEQLEGEEKVIIQHYIS